jgi:hypothetical protein
LTLTPTYDSVELATIRVDPIVMSALDYRHGLGHTKLVEG